MLPSPIRDLVGALWRIWSALQHKQKKVVLVLRAQPVLVLLLEAIKRGWNQRCLESKFGNSSTSTAMLSTSTSTKLRAFAWESDFCLRWCSVVLVAVFTCRTARIP